MCRVKRRIVTNGAVPMKQTLRRTLRAFEQEEENTVDWDILMPQILFNLDTFYFRAFLSRHKKYSLEKTIFV